MWKCFVLFFFVYTPISMWVKSVVDWWFFLCGLSETRCVLFVLPTVYWSVFTLKCSDWAFVCVWVVSYSWSLASRKKKRGHGRCSSYFNQQETLKWPITGTTDNVAAAWKWLNKSLKMQKHRRLCSRCTRAAFPKDLCHPVSSQCSFKHSEACDISFF